MGLNSSLKYEFDNQLSSKYLNENIEIIETSKCYDNIWNLLNIVPNDFDVLFCYIEYPNLANIYFRHCVYVNKDNKIIDVTLSLLNSNINIYTDSDLIVIKRLNKSEYLDALSNSMIKGYSSTDLDSYLKSVEKDIKKNLLSENKFILESF